MDASSCETGCTYLVRAQVFTCARCAMAAFNVHFEAEATADYELVAGKLGRFFIYRNRLDVCDCSPGVWLPIKEPEN